jgi:putative ABC transport system permease protein
VSVEHWLDNVLPADLYGRLEQRNPGEGFDAATRVQIAGLAGVERAEFLHVSRLALEAERPPITVLARPLDAASPQTRLPLTGPASVAPAGAIPIWISEAMVDLYGWRLDAQVEMPVPGAGRQTFFVAGIWRDYARQHGAVAVDLAAWEALAGPAPLTEFGLWLASDIDEHELIARLEALAGPDRTFSVRSASALRALSLTIFDRSFAATWALEAVAVLVALFGIAAAWSAEAIARRREFGMLRHLGLTAGSLVRQFALEAAMLVAAAVCWGIALGALIAMLLVHRVNPQSFHWTMDMAWPLGPMLAAGMTMIVLAAGVAALAGRQAGSASPVRAVREDW